MAIAHEASASSSTYASSLTYSLTIPASSNRLLMVGVLVRDIAFSCTSVTYAGVGLTFLARCQISGAMKSELWYLVAPATGANNVVVTLNGTIWIGSGASAFSDVHQVTPLGAAVTNGGTGSSSTCIVTSATGEMVYDVIGLGENFALTPGAGQTERYDVAYSGWVETGGSTEAGASSVTMSWSWTGTAFYDQVAVPILPNAGSSLLVLDPRHPLFGGLSSMDGGIW